MEEKGSGGGSFSSFRAYCNALRDAPRRVVRRAGAVWSCGEELSRVKARSGAEMQRNLRWYDLVCLGIGGMVGAGVFVTTGRAARDTAGPAVIVSYAIAGLSALLSAFCYTEFAVAMPVAGGAFSYLRTTFGELAAYMTGANLLMEYVLSNAAVARSLTSYLGAAIGTNTDSWRFKVDVLMEGYNELDLLAVAIIVLITICICYSTKESSVFNMVLTALHLGFILFIIVIGFAKGENRNFSEPAKPTSPDGFMPYGASGVFNGAAIVYFSYIGYDAVSTMAEEVKYPVKDIPIGVSGSVVIVTVLYGLLAAAMCKLVPYDMINKDAPFSMAFKEWGWVSNVVGAGASLGILTSLMVAMLGQARYMCVIGRSHVIPAWFAKVNPKTSTPVNASVFLGICTAVIALFTDLGILVSLICIGTLLVFYMVANALIYRRYVVIGKTNPWPTLGFLTGLSSIAVGFSWLWQIHGTHRSGWALGLCLCGLSAVVLTHSFWMLVPQASIPQDWGVPCMPWIPAASIFLNVFLLGSLDRHSYIRFVLFSFIALLFYVLYSVHATHDAEQGTSHDAEQGQSVIRILFPPTPALPTLPTKISEPAQKAGPDCV